MCEDHSHHEPFLMRKMMMWVYTRWVNDTLDFYLLLGRMGTVPGIGPVVRYFARQYGKYLHGGRAATVDECLEIIAQAKRFTVVECACRKKYGNCDQPLNTCLGIDTGAEVLGELKNRDFISREQAVQIVRDAYQTGLIRSVTHCVTPHLYVLCNCCTCCCVPYRLRDKYGIGSAIENGAKVARINIDQCKNCGRCLKVCPQMAITPEAGTVDADRCFGCGLCIKECRHDALKMIDRENYQPVLNPGFFERILMYTSFITVILPLAIGFKVLRD